MKYILLQEKGQVLLEKDAIEKKYSLLKKKIDTIGFICTGSVMSVYHTCGNSKCACAHDESARHGPYNRWTRKVKGKTVTRTLTDKQTEICRECINNYRNLERIIKEMKELSVQYIESSRNSSH